MELDVAGAKVYAYTGTRPVDPAKPAVVFVHGAANDHSVWLLPPTCLTGNWAMKVARTLNLVTQPYPLAGTFQSLAI